MDPFQSGAKFSQGSVFGPLAFIIFNNDLDGKTFLILIMNKFAEDTKLGHKVNIDADKQVLQKVATWENLFEYIMEYAENPGEPGLYV